MYMYVQRYEGEIASEVLPTDRVGAICFDARQVTAIGWALLASSGELKSGTIRIDRSSLAGTIESTALETALYRKAARALNRTLGSALVDRRDLTGEPQESRFYRRAGISPSWRWSGREAFALIEMLSVDLRPGLGLRAFLPIRDEPDPEIRARKYLEDYQLLRAFTRRCRAFGEEAG
jgi:hypothetical protein